MLGPSLLCWAALVLLTGVLAGQDYYKVLGGKCIDFASRVTAVLGEDHADSQGRCGWGDWRAGQLDELGMQGVCGSFHARPGCWELDQLSRLDRRDG
jgi:hypothetical protein